MAIQKFRRVPIVALNAVGDNSAVAAVAAQASPEGRILNPARKLRVMSGMVVASAPGNLIISSGLAGARSGLTGLIPLIAAEKFPIYPTFDWELAPLETKAGEDLNLFTSAAMGLAGWLMVVEVA